MYVYFYYNVQKAIPAGIVIKIQDNMPNVILSAVYSAKQMN